jgi:hypothetical protein
MRLKQTRVEGIGTMDAFCSAEPRDLKVGADVGGSIPKPLTPNPKANCTLSQRPVSGLDFLLCLFCTRLLGFWQHLTAWLH